MTEKTVKTEAIVIRSFKFGESDLILTLFGRNTGKISAIAKGARKPKSRMRGPLQLFTRGNYLLFRGKNLYTVTQCESIEPFMVLRQNLAKFAYASYCAEITREVIPEGEANLPAYNLLSQVLRMTAAEGEQLAARFFDFQMLSLSGYQPQLSCCVKCGGPVPDRPVFSCIDGGIVCCGAEGGIPVGRDTLAVMGSLFQMDIHKVQRLRASSKNLREMEIVTKAYWETILEKRLHSVEFIEKMRQFA